MKTLKHSLGCMVLLFVLGCEMTDVIQPTEEFPIDWRDNVPHVTGDVEVQWKGGGMSGPMADRLGSVDLEAFPATAKKPAKGHFTLRVMEGDVLERQIDANVLAAVVDPEQAKAWFLAVVVFDTKACETHGGPGEEGHDDGGCEGEDEGGCSGDDGHDGGCTGEDDGGCSGEDDGGCSGDDGHEGGSGGPGGSGEGSLNGQRCRIGQIVAVKVHDIGSPGANGDGLSWKWFRADANNLPDIGDVGHWPHLCKKTIVEGNLTVH